MSSVFNYLKFFKSKYVKNPYFIVGLGFLVWMSFFDHHSLIFHSRLSGKLDELKKEKAFYLDETAKISEITNELKNSPESIEKLAREKYFMHKSNEEVFIIVKKENE